MAGRTRIAWILAPLALAGCNPAKDTPEVNAQIAAFHAALNSGDFNGIYTRSSPDMKGATGQAQLVALLSAVHRKLGNFRSGSSQGWNDNVTTSGHMFTIGYAATYERGAASEQFVYRISDGHAALAGYHINSDALILN